MKILIADDNADDVAILMKWLTREGHSCTHVSDGEARSGVAGRTVRGLAPLIVDATGELIQQFKKEGMTILLAE